MTPVMGSGPSTEGKLLPHLSLLQGGGKKRLGSRTPPDLLDRVEKTPEKTHGTGARDF